MILYLIDIVFTTYTIFLLVRVLGSWFPNFSRSRFMRFVSFYTDPYLNLFRKIIPPLGMIDLSPMVALFSLQILQYFVVRILV